MKSSELVIIILNYQDYKMTLKCVDKLLSLGVKDEIIIVDNHSNNDSIIHFRNKYSNIDNVTIIENHINSGYSGGNNFGIRYASNNIDFQYLAIMNPDVILRSKSTLTSLVNVLKDKKDIAAVTALMGHIHLSRKEMTGWKLPSIFRMFCSNLFLMNKFLSIIEEKDKFIIKDDLQYVEAIHGSFFVIRYDIFNLIGLFDENIFLYYEENILGYKIKEVGYKMAVYLADSFYHNHQYKEMNLSQIKASALRRKISQQYYLRDYMGCNVILRNVIAVFYNLYIYLEIPLIKYINKIINR